MTQAAQVSAAPARAVPRVLARPDLLVFAAMSCLGLALSVRLLDPWDESWFVQVVLRMRDGDVLYRDISYGAGPLPPYLTETLTYVIGVDVLAEKLVVVLAFAATATLSWVVTRKIGMRRRDRLLVLAALLYLAPPLQEPPYAPLATTFMICALWASLGYGTSESVHQRVLWIVAGGASCGLAFACKQNVGAYSLAALVFLILVERRLRDVLWAVGAFTAAAGLALLPVFASGGLTQYLDYGFTGKGQYVEHGFGFLNGFDGVFQTIRDVHSPASAEGAYWGVRFFFPILAAIALVGLATRKRLRRAETLPLAVFAVVSLITLFPRFDTGHVAYANPPLVLLVAFVLHSWGGPMSRAARIASGVWLSLAVAIALSLPLRLARSPEANLSDLPHLRGAFVQATDLARWHRDAERLAAIAGDRRDSLLVLTPDAGLRYLSSRLQNPTPFDFPFVTTFGTTGEKRVIDAFRSGRIQRVCLADQWYGLGPPAIISYVHRAMRPGPRLGFCRIYRES